MEFNDSLCFHENAADMFPLSLVFFWQCHYSFQSKFLLVIFRPFFDLASRIVLELMFDKFKKLIFIDLLCYLMVLNGSCS